MQAALIKTVAQNPWLTFKVSGHGQNITDIGRNIAQQAQTALSQGDISGLYNTAQQGLQEGVGYYSNLTPQQKEDIAKFGGAFAGSLTNNPQAGEAVGSFLQTAEQSLANLWQQAPETLTPEQQQYLYNLYYQQSAQMVSGNLLQRKNAVKLDRKAMIKLAGSEFSEASDNDLAWIVSLQEKHLKN